MRDMNADLLLRLVIDYPTVPRKRRGEPTRMEPLSENVMLHMHWAARLRVRKSLYAHMLVAMRAWPRYERAVQHSLLPPERRAVRFLRRAGPGTGVRRFDSSNFSGGACKLALDVLKPDSGRNRGLGVIHEDSRLWVREEYVESPDADVPVGKLGIEVYSVADDEPKWR